MTYTAITLTDPVSGLSSVIKPRDGVAVMALEVTPSVRGVSDPRPGGDGAFDVTQFADAAAVTLTLRLWTSDAGFTPEEFLDEIGPLLAPWRRPVLVCSNDSWAGDRQFTVRFDSKSGPVDNPVSTDVALSWKVPSGAWQDTVIIEVDIGAQVASSAGLHMAATTGLDVKPTVGITMPATTTGGDSLVTVGGSLNPPWTARLYGPCTGPKLANDTAGQDLIFTDSLVLGAGQYVLIDSQARTAQLMSDPAQNQLQFLDFANSRWWPLLAGQVNQVRYHPTSGSGQAQLLFAAARLP